MSFVPKSMFLYKITKSLVDSVSPTEKVKENKDTQQIMENIA